MEKSTSTRICALVPTYNNAGTIIDVLRRVHQHMHSVIVVDDGCTDNTAALLASLDFPVTVVRHPKNQGKGRALASGFRKAMEMGFTHALTIDADGQHYPEDIPLLLRALDIHPSALIVGSRQFTDENMSGKSKFANKFSNFWFRLQTTVNLPDTQTGMRIYPLTRLYGLRLLTSRYEAELELLVFAAWHNVPLVPVPIRVYYPPQNERVSHFRPARDFTRISILNCFLCLGALLFGYINMYWRTVLCALYFGIVMLFFVVPYTWLLFAFKGRNAATRAHYHRFVQRMSAHFAGNIVGLKLSVHGQLKDEQSVVISNHLSFIDIILVLSLTSKIVIVLKDYIWKAPLIGTVARYLDCFPLSYDDEQREARIKRIMDEGYSLFVFPEGTRSGTGEIGRFHRGAFYYAGQYGLPIQPVLIQGMADYLNKRHFAIKPAEASLTVLPPVAPDDTSWGANYKKRAKSFEYYYSALLHSNKTRVGILGAGVSGLFCGALLAQRGYEVTLLEQLPVFGGGLYSYERIGETWLTGMHVLSGLEPDGPVTKVLDSLGITAHVVPTTLDHSPASLIGEAEWSNFHSVYRFVGGSQSLANDLALYITRHGGRLLTGQKVERIEKENLQFTISNHKSPYGVSRSEEITNHKYDLVVSTLHPKQLLKITDLPWCRTIARKRIETTPETFGSFKTYLRLQPDTLPYDPVTHFMPEHTLLVMTPCSKENQRFARTIETVMPLDYSELSLWIADRKAHYEEYEAYKQRKTKEVIAWVEKIYPGVGTKIMDSFSSTSLTYRDDFLSPEGAMFGMTESLGSVRTRVPGLYLSGQNIFLHGLCGVVMTAQQTVQALCDDCD